MKTRLQIYGRGDFSHKHGDFAKEVNTIGTRRMLVGTHRGGELPARPARWILGKSGDTTTQEFEVLFAGQDSAESQSEVGGYSLEYSTTDSVSVFWRDGDDHTRDEIEAAFDAAVNAGLEYAMEQVFLTNVDGDLMPISGVHAINYFHTMKSFGLEEPALHQHVLINNYGKLPSGKIAGIDAEHFQSQLDAMVEIVGTEFRKQLSQRLSVKWIEDANGNQEIEGVELTK